MRFTTVKKLYKGKFQYNIVLGLAFGEIFKGNSKSAYESRYLKHRSHIFLSVLGGYRVGHDEATTKLFDQLMKMENYATRFSAPYLTIYSNNYEDLTDIRNLIPDFVESIGLPPEGLEPGMVYMPNMPYDFRVTIRNIHKLNPEFVEWVSNNDNVKLQLQTEKLLSERPSSYKSGSLYVKGERNLVFVKMHLGSFKLTIDRILN